MACSTDKFAATYVVAPDLGAPDCKVADFTDIQNAVDALPPTGGKIFVKAGNYVISDTIKFLTSNVHLQGEGMGVTNIIAAQTMTDRPAIEVYDQRIGYDKGDVEVREVVAQGHREHFLSQVQLLMQIVKVTRHNILTD